MISRLCVRYELFDQSRTASRSHLVETFETIFHLIFDTQTSIGKRTWIGEHSCWASAMRVCVHARKEHKIYLWPPQKGHTRNYWRLKRCRSKASQQCQYLSAEQTETRVWTDQSWDRVSAGTQTQIFGSGTWWRCLGRWINQRVENAKL